MVELLEEEKRPTRHCLCADCARGDRDSVDLYHCSDCFLFPPSCAAELLRRHASLPFHAVRRWSSCKGFWETSSLFDVGLVVSLGHGGVQCGFIRDGTKPRHMTAIHANGIGQLAVQFCACESKSEASQLIQAGLWPASWTQPRTVYDIRLMEHFRLLSVIAHTNAYDFFNLLAWKTDPLLPPSTKVRCSAFIEGCVFLTRRCRIAIASFF